MINVTIREFTLDDAEEIYLLNKNGLSYDYPIEKTKQKLSIIKSLSTNKIFVATIDNQVVGYIHASEYECSYSDSLKNILALVVNENYRKQGVGKKLMLAVENWAVNTNSIGVRLVSGFNREIAHKFYQQCGYTLRKEQKNFIKFL